MGIITKRGDWGATVTLAGEEVSKSDLRVHCVGTLDELSSFLGFARSLIKEQGFEDLASDLRALQLDLYRLGSELSSGAHGSVAKPITENDVTAIEDKATTLEAETEMPHTLIVSGSCSTAAAIDMARTVARRLERLVIEAREKGFFLNFKACTWINRVSDYLFILARAVERRAGVEFDRV